MRHEAVSGMPPQPGAVSGSESGPILKTISHAPMTRWQGWRLRVLALFALFGCLMTLLLASETANLPHLNGEWVVTPDGQLELRASAAASLAPHVGKRLDSLSAQGQIVDLRDAALLQRSPRWLIDDADRANQLKLHRGIAKVLAHREVTWTFADGSSVIDPVFRRDIGDLPALFWLLGVCAASLYVLGMAVLLVRPSTANWLYVTMALCQAGNLGFSAFASAFDLGFPPGFLRIDFAARAGFDLIMAAATIHLSSIIPRRIPGAHLGVALAWGVSALCLSTGLLFPQAWWGLQAVASALASAVVAMLAWSHRVDPQPSSRALFRLAALTTGLWIAFTATLALTSHQPWWQARIAAAGSIAWYLLIAAALAISPLLLSRSRQVIREFGLLVAISTLAVAQHLLLVEALGANRFFAAALSLLAAWAAYIALRKWLIAHLLGASMITTERMFERLYRIAREVESHPERTPKLLAELLTDLFDPLETRIIRDPMPGTGLVDAGSTMLVPVPAVAVDAQGFDGAVMLRFAQRGNRLFTAEDMQLARRIVEQLERAVAYDRAVERGRGEERLRIAQDLHDDIGARLLTLIYKAQSPEMEEYARHTLQDLKTLTRGLAASSHRLSHAAGEWKADLTHRLSAANIDLGWSCEFDDDALLGMVQWSALTRILRELVSNTIAHSAAGRVDVNVRLENDCLQLSVSDDGRGQDPKAWAHGLGLGGVRKRVKQLNGHVEWSEAVPHGICCQVTIQNLSGQSFSG